MFHRLGPSAANSSAIAPSFIRSLFAVAAMVAATLALPGCGSVPPPAAILPLPTERQLAWHEMEMNAFVHFSINTFTDREWGYGSESPALFNPTAFDADQWASVFREAGFKGVILTAKHHDGFCLWPSAHTEHDVASSPFRNGEGDLVGELAEACRREGLKFGIYVSPWDRNHPDYGEASYITYYREQLAELFSAYGPIFEMWFDGANGGSGWYGGADETRRVPIQTYYDWPTTLELVRGWEPEVLFFSDAGPDLRWCGNERGRGGLTNWNTFTTAGIYPGKPDIGAVLNSGMEDGEEWVPAEVNTSIRPGWFYHPDEDDRVKSPEELFETYLNSVGRGSTLLLNIPPDRRGLIHENDVAVLREWRRLLDEAFAVDLAREGAVSATSWRGSSSRFAPDRVTDGIPDTYWATDDEITTGSLEIALPSMRTVTYVAVQEDIRLGQRIRAFTVEMMGNDGWATVAEGTTIGYRRILRPGPIETDRIRITFTDAKGPLVISAVSVY